MMEQLYSDFTTKLLPQLQQGLTITKDYFFDLFGRYVKYLILTDSLIVLVFTIIFIFGITLAIRTYTKPETKVKRGFYSSNPTTTVWTDFTIFKFAVSIVLMVVGIVNMVLFGLYLIKDFTIPEIRIMEKLNIIKVNL